MLKIFQNIESIFKYSSYIIQPVILHTIFLSNREGLIPGPQVPPRNPQETSPGSNGDRVLSVSGKKRCSHCKEELGKQKFIFYAIIGSINLNKILYQEYVWNYSVTD